MAQNLSDTGADLGYILTDFLNEGPREQASREARGLTKVPFPRFLSNARKLEKENICTCRPFSGFQLGKCYYYY